MTLDLAPVEALERAMAAATKQAEPTDEDLGRAYRWSDDFPEGSITLTGPTAAIDRLPQPRPRYPRWFRGSSWGSICRGDAARERAGLTSDDRR
jgi:hypothetical protein